MRLGLKARRSVLGLPREDSFPGLVFIFVVSLCVFPSILSMTLMRNNQSSYDLNRVSTGRCFTTIFSASAPPSELVLPHDGPQSIFPVRRDRLSWLPP